MSGMLCGQASRVAASRSVFEIAEPHQPSSNRSSPDQSITEPHLTSTTHINAALSLKGCRSSVVMFVEQGWTVISAAAAAEITVRCARKRVGRYGLG